MTTKCFYVAVKNRQGCDQEAKRVERQSGVASREGFNNAQGSKGKFLYNRIASASKFTSTRICFLLSGIMIEDRRLIGERKNSRSKRGEEFAEGKGEGWLITREDRG